MFQVNSTLPARRGKVDARSNDISWPFAFAQAEYQRNGWPVFPVDGKVIPRGLTGITGHNGHDPSEFQTMDWARSPKYAQMNIALRCAEFGRWWAVGIDVDAYDNRAACRTWRLIERETGVPMPRTWRSTSRAPEDAASGIYLFRVPRGTYLRGSLGAGSGIDIIQRAHRYIVSWPSIHPETGNMYHWWKGRNPARPPSVHALPRLPREWVSYLKTSTPVMVNAAYSDADAARWFRRVSVGRECPLMREAARSAAAEIRMADRRGGLHETMTRVTWSLCHYASEGHTGLGDALDLVGKAFFRSHRKRGLQGEWSRALANAKAHAASVEQYDYDPCDEAGIGGWNVIRLR